VPYDLRSGKPPQSMRVAGDPMNPDAANAMKFSLVIPAWNEAALLPRLLDSVAVARTRWRESGHGAGDVEVIVADNQSSDATARIASQAGCRVATVEKRVIAATRNGGAAVAQGEILCFIDADSIVHPDTFLAIAAAMADLRTVGGATGVTMERWSLGIALSYAMMLPLAWLTDFDTGVVFCRRADFEAIGGYDEQRMVAEDVDFLWRLRRLARTRGQRLVRLRGVKAVTSTRKFDIHGDWHYFQLILAQAWRLLRDRGALNDIARRYWYEGR
jgi:glycosyltransferase involved in cell wall biosynthesis